MKTYKFIRNYLYAKLAKTFGIKFKKIAFLLAFPLPSSAQIPMTFRVLKNFKLLFLFALLGFGGLLAPTSHSQETDNLNFQSPGAADPIQGLMKKGFPGVSAAIPCQQMPPATNSLSPFATETGMISLSTDAAGTTTTSGFVRVKKPAGAMVRKAYLVAASQPKIFTTIDSGDITINGTAVAFNESKTNCLFEQGQSVNNYWGDVTSQVETTINGDNAEEISIRFTEPADKTIGIDGVILAVIFDDPNQTTNNTVKLFFGGQNPRGDNFTVDFGDSINKDAPNFALDMSLGISYGNQSQPRLQFNEVNVNGARLTSSAGGEDDSRDSLANDGALITVGGFGGLGGDRNNNPVPTAPPNGADSDDELYDLRNFVSSGSTSVNIATINPPNDDNMFFAAFFIGNHMEVPPPTRTISGRITNNGNGLSGVAVALTGSNFNRTVMTAANGDYTISGIPSGGNYTVTPSRANFTFTPPSRTYSNLSADQTAQNFTATLPCEYDIEPESANISSNAGTYSFNVLTSSECQWQATTTTPWITTESNGTGSGTISYTVAANDTATPRTGTIMVGGQTFTVNQDGALTISGRITIDGNGLGGVTLTLTGLNLTPRSVITEANGNYSISGIPSGGNYTVTPSRANFTFTPPSRIYNNLRSNQTAENYIAISTCVYTINPTSASVSSDAGTYNFNIAVNADCEWNAVPSPSSPWITTTSSGTGNGTISYTVAANTLSPRSGTITVGRQTFTVNQTGFHAISGRITNNGISLSGVSVALTGADFNITVTTNSSGDYFIFNVPSGGDYTVTPSLANYIFDPPSRTYNNLSSEQPFQDFTGVLNCSYTISPTSSSVLSSGGNFAFKIFTLPVCSWRAATNVPWLTTTSSGMGNGTVSYTVAANPTGVLRVGTITVGGQTVTVSQNDTENTTYAISGQVTNNGNPISGVTIVAEGPITRTTVTNLNGEYELTGLFPADYEVRPILAGALFAPVSRPVTITNASVSNRNFAFDTCIYSLSSPGRDVSAGTTSDSFDVSTAAGCEWTAVTNVPWIVIENGDIGAGNAAVSYFVQRNYGESRSGTIAVNGQLFTVRQAAFQQSLARNGQPDTPICNFRLIDPSDTNNKLRQVVSHRGTSNAAFEVVTQSNCQWEASRDGKDNWIKITTSATLTGPATVNFSVDPITGTDPRFGIIKVGGKIFTIVQTPKPLVDNAGNESCPSSLSPGFNNYGAGIETGSSDFMISLLCKDRGVASIVAASWTNFTGSAVRSNGTVRTDSNGKATIRFATTANIGTTRRFGTVVVQDKFFTIEQAEGMRCSFQLSSDGQNFAARSQGTTNGVGEGRFAVITGPDCLWTATSNVPWLRTNNVGEGNGTVSFTIEPNPNPTARPGKIMVDDQEFTVTQDGNQQACSYTIEPAFQDIAETGAAGNIRVTENTACSSEWSAVPNDGWIKITARATGNRGSGSVNFVAETNDKSFAREGTITVAGQTFTINQAAGTGIARTPSRFDFDGDGRADISVFRPSEGLWYLNNSTAGFSAIQFGLAADRLVPDDYDGDGKTDVAVYRNGTWFALRSSDGTFSAVSFGLANDIPVPADYDGDGRADQAVYRAGTWFLNRSTNGFAAISFGLATDQPVPADYDGDDKTDIAVYRNGTWFMLGSSTNFRAVQFGQPGDIPVPADYDGDGKTDVAVYRNGTWFILGSNSGYRAIQFGLASDKPVPADYDGDGKADVAVFRNGTWFLQGSTQSLPNVGFGLATDTPVPNVFVP